MQHFLVVLAVLLAVHAFFDFPGQGEFLSAMKSGRVEIFPWWYGLTVHALIQGVATGAVAWLFDPRAAFVIGFCEFIWHWVIDMFRVKNFIGAMTDQGLHIACKLLFAFSLAIPAFTVVWHP
jgi:hypothetical protein